MPWCPKCRNEYIEGMTVCNDCGVELVDELPEEIAPEAPVILCTVADEQIGAKFIAYLNYGGIQTAGLMPVKSAEISEAVDDAPADSDDTSADSDDVSADSGSGFHVVVAEFEKEAAEKMFEGFGSVEEIAQTDISELVPELEKQLEELQNEEANRKLSEMRTEASSVYVKKEDKYQDLKFSGISFIIFGILGSALVAANALGVLHLFNKFSTLVIGVIFVVFFIVGVRSLLRAGKLKNIVTEERKATDEVLDWVDENITDEKIAAMTDESLSEEDQYFTVHSELCRIVSEQFPYFNKEYIDQLMDERYNEFCDNKE